MRRRCGSTQAQVAAVSEGTYSRCRQTVHSKHDPSIHGCTFVLGTVYGCVRSQQPKSLGCFPAVALTCAPSATLRRLRWCGTPAEVVREVACRPARRSGVRNMHAGKQCFLATTARQRSDIKQYRCKAVITSIHCPLTLHLPDSCWQSAAGSRVSVCQDPRQAAHQDQVQRKAGVAGSLPIPCCAFLRPGCTRMVLHPPKPWVSHCRVASSGCACKKIKNKESQAAAGTNQQQAERKAGDAKRLRGDDGGRREPGGQHAQPVAIVPQGHACGVHTR